jgi:very-short-patch-repair endonuclease
MDYPVREQRVDRAKIELAKGLRAEQTGAEDLLWRRLRKSQLDDRHFRRQQIIAGFVVDFLCNAAHLVVEIDGGIHAEQIEADAERERILVALGFRVIRFRNEEIETNIESVLARIAQAVGTTPSPLPSREGGQGG